MFKPFQSCVARACLVMAVAAVATTAASPARAHGGPSEASALSALPLALSVAAPALLLSAGAVFTVVAVEASAKGTVWVLERASDGAQVSITVAGAALSAAVGGASLLVGAVVTVTAVSAGWLLSAAGQVIAFVPNELGRALLHHERITR